jgi:lipopolysaccharide assembly protein A
VQFLKILFWFLLAFVAALFTYGNWTSVPIRLWNNMILDVNLPLLLLAAVLAGAVPTWVYQAAARWRLRRRLQQTERAITAFAAPPPPSPPAPVEPQA